MKLFRRMFWARSVKCAEWEVKSLHRERDTYPRRLLEAEADLARARYRLMAIDRAPIAHARGRGALRAALRDQMKGKA